MYRYFFKLFSNQTRSSKLTRQCHKISYIGALKIVNSPNDSFLGMRISHTGHLYGICQCQGGNGRLYIVWFAPLRVIIHLITNLICQYVYCMTGQYDCMIVCPGTATEARLDGSEGLNALTNLSTFFWLSYQLLFFVFTSIFPIISFHSSKDATTQALIVKCDGQRVQRRCR